MSCVAPNCKSGYGSDCKLPPGVTKHIFPKDDASRRAWIDAVPRDDWEPSTSSILCSLHFTDDDFQIERCDTNPHRKNGDLKRRRLKKGAVPSVFAVNEDERCLIPSCRRISNTHTFPRYPEQRKKWILAVRNYLMDPKWQPTPTSRLCSKHFVENQICKVYRRSDKLRPNALPFIDKDQFPPNLRKEYPKIIPMPKIDYESMEPKPILNSNNSMMQTIIVKKEADYERTFVLDKSPIKRTLVASTADISACQSQQLHLQQLQQQPHQLGPGENVSGEPIILMRTKGNPNVLVQVEAQLWTPTGKLPKLPALSQTQPMSMMNDLKNAGQNNKLSEGELKDKTIEKLRAECAKLARRVTHFQDQANDSKTKMEKIVKNLSSLFGEDQVTLLCGGPIKRCTQWSEKTLAKAFDLRLNCGDRAYKYLLEQGYPLPSLKTMQRHIRSVEVKLQHPEATFITTSQEDSDGETVELHHEDLQHSQQQHHIIPVQHAYLQQFGNQQIIKVSHVSGEILSNRPETIHIETSDDLNHRPSPAKRAKKQEAEGPTWYAKLSKEVRQKILFPDNATATDLMPQTTVTTVSTGNHDERIYLAPDLEYAMIPVTDASGHTVVQQVAVQQHKVDDDDDVKEYTTMEVSAGAPIHLHVVDEDNRTIQVLNVDNQGYVTNFN